MLLQWGMNFADREGLDIFAQTSPMIMSFETKDKLGFEVIDEWTLDVKDLRPGKAKDCRWPLTKKLVKRTPSNVRARHKDV
jgi:hypothetical protein